MKKLVVGLIVGAAIGFAVGHLSAPKVEASDLQQVEDLWLNSTFDPRGGTGFNDGHGCIGEDNGWDRVMLGELAAGESFTATLDLCTSENGYLGQYGPGGGFMAWAEGASIRIEGPRGEVYEGTHRCVVPLAYGPPYYTTTNGTKHPTLYYGGRWRFTVTGLGGAVALRINAKMSSWQWQVDYCPDADRDTDPAVSVSEFPCVDPRLPLPYGPDVYCYYDDLPRRPYLPTEATPTRSPTATATLTTTPKPTPVSGQCWPPKSKKCR